MAFLISQLAPVAVRGSQLSSITGYPVWGTVTHIEIDKITRTNRLRIVGFAISSGVIIVAYGALVAIDMFNIDIAQRFL